METILPVSAGQIFIQHVVWFSDFSRGGRVFLHAGVCLGVLRLGRGLEGGVGVCRIVLVVVWGVFPSYNSTASLPHLNNITDHNQRPTRHPPPLLCYQKISVPIAWKYFMFQLLLIFSTDFWNNAPLIFHRNCQFWLERVKETNVCSDLVLQHGPTSRAMPRGNHNINIK